MAHFVKPSPQPHRFSKRCLPALQLVLLLGGAMNAHAGPDTARFNQLLRLGDSVYSLKQGYASFAQSLRYFDSAQVLAEQSNAPDLLADAVFARGRVYDAWNKEPLKTVELFTEATRLFRQIGRDDRYFYSKHLVAHAYDKMSDSVGATTVLRELVVELSAKDTGTRHGVKAIPEMALIATQVRAYGLADSILRLLTRRSWIENDPLTYNYLDHYYLTQSRLDVYWKGKRKSLYLDSLAAAYEKLHAPLDRMYYAQQLADLYDAIGNYTDAYKYLRLQRAEEAKLSSGNDFEQMQQALVVSETAAERRKLEYETAISRSRAVALWILSLLLAVITILSVYLYQRNKKFRKQSDRLHHTNHKLDEQVRKVELMNKEIQHRIKNNLYTIYSLLHMQQESTDNEEVAAHLETARMRVESVAALHDHLLGHTGTVNFEAYIKELVHKIVECFAESTHILTHINAKVVSLPLNTSFALSLILNEWLTNSVKYAKPAHLPLVLDISITSNASHLCIEYRDNGLVDKKNPIKPGLGTEIIRLLTVQIEGNLQLVNDEPHHYKLYLPYERQD